MGLMPITVLIPTINRPCALSVTLTSLLFQDYQNFSVVIADQTEPDPSSAHPSVQTAIRVLKEHGHAVTILRNLPKQGIAQQRQFLLDQVQTPYCLFLDDDQLLEPFVLSLLMRSITKLNCGFVGSATIALSYTKDIRPLEQQFIEFWQENVEPETVTPRSKKWQRHLLHNAANPYHLAKKFRASVNKPLFYKIAWVGGCILYDTDKLRSMGGFSFWKHLPKESVGEDVLAQLRVMKKYGGCGVLPSGVYHQELPTTLPKRDINAPEILEQL